MRGAPAVTTGRELDLDDLIRRGLGDVALIRLPLRCATCDNTGHKIVGQRASLRDRSGGLSGAQRLGGGRR